MTTLTTLWLFSTALIALYQTYKLHLECTRPEWEVFDPRTAEVHYRTTSKRSARRMATALDMDYAREGCGWF
jgi:hypothetical protein